MKARRPWCLPCRYIDGSRVWAEHLGIACDWHWGYLSASDQAAMVEAVKRIHPRGGRIRTCIEQIVVVRMDLRQQNPPNGVEEAWERDRADVVAMAAANDAVSANTAHVTDADDPLSCWCEPYRDNVEPMIIIHRKEGEA